MYVQSEKQEPKIVPRGTSQEIVANVERGLPDFMEKEQLDKCS